MNRPFAFSIRSVPFAALILLLDASAMAQVAELEPRWLRLDIPQVSLGVDAEGVVEDASLQGSSSTHEYMSLTPFLGLGLHGSIYHPKLMTFDVNGEAGLGWTTDTVTGAGYDQTRNENRDLLRYLATVNFLAEKPYNATVFAAQDHTYNNYDFFNTTTVDSLRYGAQAAWTTDSLNLAADFGYRDETASGLNGTSQIAETYFNFNGMYNRQTGRSTLTYRFNEFENTLNEGGTQKSLNHTIGASDSETFGSRKQVTATTGASFSQYQYSGRQTETLTADENVTINHRPNLDSYFFLYYTHSSLDPITSSVLQGKGILRHRLYDSLTSSLEVHGFSQENSTPVNSASTTSYGAGVQEDYTKRLGSWGRLSVGAGLNGDHQENNASGTILTTIDETHQLFLPSNPQYRPAYLNNPRVITPTIAVYGPKGLAREGYDYEIYPAGERTEIRLRQPLGDLQDKDTVRVTYQSDSLYTASFESFGGGAQIRLDLLNLFGVYGRVNWLDNNAPPEILAETFTDLVFGIDAAWRWFRAGAEYEDYDSNFNQYQSLRFFETYSCQPFEGSTFGLEFSQLFYRYPGDRHEYQYQFISRFNTQLTSWLSSYFEGGYFLQDIVGTEENLAAARVGFSLTRGRLSAQTGYQYNYQLTKLGASEEQRNRNVFFVHLRRTF